jgi:hypothetical protein
MSTRPVLAAATAAAIAALTVAPAALGAPATGPYTGVSQAKVIWKYQQFVPEVQKGKVTFTVRKGAVTGFRVRGQRAQCPGTPGAPVVNVTIPRMALAGNGTARATVIHPNFGPLTVKLRVTGARATGRVIYPASCRTTATFTARHR